MMIVDYEGPSLSDLGSLAGTSEASGTESGWNDGARSRNTRGENSKDSGTRGGRKVEAIDLEDWEEVDERSSFEGSEVSRERRDGGRVDDWGGAKGPAFGRTPAGGEGLDRKSVV